MLKRNRPETPLIQLTDLEATRGGEPGPRTMEDLEGPGGAVDVNAEPADVDTSPIDSSTSPADVNADTHYPAPVDVINAAVEVI